MAGTHTRTYTLEEGKELSCEVSGPSLLVYFSQDLLTDVEIQPLSHDCRLCVNRSCGRAQVLVIPLKRVFHEATFSVDFIYDKETKALFIYFSKDKLSEIDFKSRSRANKDQKFIFDIAANDNTDELAIIDDDDYKIISVEIPNVTTTLHFQ